MTITAHRTSRLISMFALALLAACDGPSGPLPEVAAAPVAAPEPELVAPLIDDLVVSEHYTLSDDEECPTRGEPGPGASVETDLALTNLEFAALTTDELKDLCLYQDPNDGSFHAADCSDGAQGPTFAAAPRVYRATGDGCSFCGDNSILCGNKAMKKSGLVWCGILGTDPCICGGISLPGKICC